MTGSATRAARAQRKRDESLASVGNGAAAPTDLTTVLAGMQALAASVASLQQQFAANSAAPAAHGSDDAQIIHPLDGRVFTPRIDERASLPLDGGTVDDREYPAKNVSQKSQSYGKPFKVIPAYRKRFVQSFKPTTMRLLLVVESGGEEIGEIDLGTVAPTRFQTGNHGLQGNVAGELTDSAGYTHKIGGNVNLMLQDCTPPRG